MKKNIYLKLSFPLEMSQIDHKHQARLIWTSYGITNVCLAFLSSKEALQLQILNQFSYTIAISRVQTRLSLHLHDGTVFYLADFGHPDYSNTVFKLDSLLPR